jgi:hypothetical protein
VAVNNQEGSKESGNQQRLRRIVYPPIDEWKQKGAHQRAKRNVPAHCDHNQKRHGRDQERKGRDITECPDKAGNCLTAPELQKHWVAVADHHCRRRQCNSNGISMRQPVSEPNCEQSLDDVKKENDYSRPFAGGTMDIGCSDISTPNRSDVQAERQANKPVSEWQTADEVCNERRNGWRKKGGADHFTMLRSGHR